MFWILKGIPEIEYNTPDDVAREINRLESERIRPPNPKGNEFAGIRFQVNSLKNLLPEFSQLKFREDLLRVFRYRIISTELKL